MRVLIADKMDAVAAEIFTARGIQTDTKMGLKPDELATLMNDYDGIAVRSSTKIGADILKTPGSVRVIGRAGIGIDTIDVPAATNAGVVVMNTPFGNSVTTAEHTIAMMMALARQIPAANGSTHAGKWEKSAFMGVELMNKVLGVVGCGNIGSIVAARALGLQMKVMAYDPYLNDARAMELGVTRATLDEIYASADFITVHTPMTDATRGLINAAAIEKMKKGVRLINCARGGLIVEGDLKAALDRGHVAGAALDVFETEPATENILFGHPNVICTPHLGASTAEAQVNVARQIAEQMADFLLSGAVANAVNMPSVSAEDAPRLKPFMALATDLGGFARELMDGTIQKIAIQYQGRVAKLNIKPLTACVLASLLKSISDTVNMVNGATIAKSSGIMVEESTTDTCVSFDAAVSVTVQTDKGSITITGTLFAGRDPRIVNIDGVGIEAAVAKHMLFIRNRDQPGMIGALGTMLADAGVNIADFRLGRVRSGGDAIALVALDSPLNDGLFARVQAIPQIQTARRMIF